MKLTVALLTASILAPQAAFAEAKLEVANAAKAAKRAWVGAYDDIRQSKPGQYNVSLPKTSNDGYYPGIYLLPDGAIVAMTYGNFRQENIGCSNFSVCLKMSEVDDQAAKHLSGAMQ